MSISWQQMSASSFAKFVSLLGPKTIRVGDTDWVEVRPFFYRTLMPMRVYHPATVNSPFMAKFGGAQYPVAAVAESNSYLNWLIFEEASNYSQDRLDKNRRRQVRLASQEFEIRPMLDEREFKQKAYPVYLSFHDRTNYKVGAQRRDPRYFAEWVDQLFKIPHVLTLGAYRHGELQGISLSYLVDHTVFYATFFCNSESLNFFLSDLMLHTVRTAAAATPQVDQVFAGMFKGIRGLDDFYLHRGAKLVRQRARLTINPVARALLSNLLPRQYAQLLGHLTDEQLRHTGAIS